jgi:radical SAM enzyme (TIGR01210 family)
MRRENSIYPEHTGDRKEWIEKLRQPRNDRDAWQPYAFHNETELSPAGEMVDSSVIFLTNRECPWRCVMCDLWKNTLNDTVPEGAIPHQVKIALKNLPKAYQVKLYNSGSFFDRKAVPVSDYAEIAGILKPFKRIIVESHPDLVGEQTLRFRDMLNGKLEVAMGLETAHPAVLEKLNKGITIDSFRETAMFLDENDIDLRVFILVKPPFMNEEEGLEWACRSIDFAFEVKAKVAIVIPTRGGNGAMELLQSEGLFSPPKLHLLEQALDYGLSLNKGRVFADLWDLEQFSECSSCFDSRKKRLEYLNQTQVYESYPLCEECNYLNQ